MPTKIIVNLEDLQYQERKIKILLQIIKNMKLEINEIKSKM